MTFQIYADSADAAESLVKWLANPDRKFDDHLDRTIRLYNDHLYYRIIINVSTEEWFIIKDTLKNKRNEKEN